MKPIVPSFALCLLTTLLCIGSSAGESRPRSDRSPTPRYLVQAVEFTHPADGVKLAGTLFLPSSKGPHPAVVLLSGSGPYVRDPRMPEGGYFGPLASRLLQKGIAVLHYDKRGCGKSEGNRDLLQSTMSDFADDARAAVKYLQGRKEIDPKRVGLYGHSEGSSTAPLAASRSKEAAFLVLTGASVLTADAIILTQVEAQAPVNGESPEVLQKNLEALRLTFDLLRTETDDQRAKARLTKLLKERQPERSPVEAAAQFGSMISPYFRFHLSHDQKATMAQVRCPILVVNGDRDLLVVEKFNTQPLREALKGHTDATLKLLPGLDHMLFPSEAGSQEEPEKTIAPEALDVISDWIGKHTGKSSR